MRDDVVRYRSRPCAPGERGRRLGRDLGDMVRQNVDVYRRLWQLAGRDAAQVHRLGAGALERSARFAPELALEMEGIAHGAGLPAELVGAMNARTELLAPAAAAECSVAVAVGAGGAVGVQTWDWHEQLAGGWLVWEIERDDGPGVRTLTEAGIVGKLGVSDGGVGVLLNILAHDDDGPERGVPVHVAARAVLDRAGGAAEAASILAALTAGASSAVTVLGEDGACTIELSPCGAGRADPEDGLLLHTNHFLAAPGRDGDAGRRDAPDTLERLDALRRALAGVPRPLGLAALARAYDDAGCGEGCVCCHPPAAAPLGEGWQTLATVAVDPVSGTLAVVRGGPCGGAARRLSEQAQAAA